MNDELGGPRSERITVDVVVPVYNESSDLEWSVRRLRRYLDDAFPFEAIVTIADNASTDDTWEIATRLQDELPGVRALHLERKGRGRALRTAWTRSDAEILAYMDVDLSTGLDALLPLIAPLASGHSELAIGTRLARASRVVRGPKRELISRSYNALLRALLHTGFSDAECGFKAIRAREAEVLLPAVEDNEWFFDTELLVLAERNGLRIHEVPVDWFDDPDSRVHLAHTAMADLRGIARLLNSFGRGGGYVEASTSRRQNDDLAELSRFAGLGVANPLAFFASYFLLFLVLGTSMNSYLANGLALHALHSRILSCSSLRTSTTPPYAKRRRDRRECDLRDVPLGSSDDVVPRRGGRTRSRLTCRQGLRPRCRLGDRRGHALFDTARVDDARPSPRLSPSEPKVRPDGSAPRSKEPLPNTDRQETSTGASPERKS